MIRAKYRIEPGFQDGEPFVNDRFQIFDCYSGLYLGGISITTSKDLVKKATHFGGTGETAMIAMLPWASGKGTPVVSEHGYRADLVAERQIYRPYCRQLPWSEQIARFLWRFGDLAFVTTASAIASIISSAVTMAGP